MGGPVGTTPAAGALGAGEALEVGVRAEGADAGVDGADGPEGAEGADAGVEGAHAEGADARVECADGAEGVDAGDAFGDAGAEDGDAGGADEAYRGGGAGLVLPMPSSKLLLHAATAVSASRSEVRVVRGCLA